MKQDVRDFVTTCDICQRIKAPRTRPGHPQGTGNQIMSLYSLSPPERRGNGEGQLNSRRYAAGISTDYLRSRVEALQLARQHVQEAQNRQSQQANRHRRDQDYEPGDLVMLSARNLQSNGVRKLSDRGTPPIRPEPDLSYGEPEYEVEALLQHRQVRRC